MNDDALDGAANRDELEAFDARHPGLRPALNRLQAKLGEAFLRTLTPRPDRSKDLQVAIFCLGHQAADDFFDVVLLAAHGYGFGAVKMLRPLFERVVTALYLMDAPSSELEAFNKYADIDAWHLLKWAQVAGIDPAAFMSAEELAQAKEAYERVKPDFMPPPRASDSRPNKRRRERGTWSDKDLAARAERVGLKSLYGPAGLWPTLHLHTTRVGFEQYLSRSGSHFSFTHRPRREEADHAMKYAHALVVLLLKKCDDFFGWQLDLKEVGADVERCWPQTMKAT